ncbi:DNA cytosine methyltransferase [Halorubrum distributum]|uniref:DNA cytosine methyltransferase n=1 Tax=Halorubrum distributum TaxID=29283 RepID=UPI000A805B60|nr:DNA cytosine methyltransferase [Halorubrum litoreum]
MTNKEPKQESENGQSYESGEDTAQQLERIHNRMNYSSDDNSLAEPTVRAVDLFCGAGGTLEGLSQACDDLGLDLQVTAVNHWETAIETHKRNHPSGDHHVSKVEELHPPDVVEEGGVDVLIASPECTHFSVARGGKPVNDQKRASPWHVLDWVEKLRPKNVLLENVRELESWGPIDDEGQPTRNGEIFETWINAFHALGYSVDWQVLNAANYGDPTTRKRLFVVGRRGRRASFPEPTHSDADDELPDWRPAAEVIDWSDAGESLWKRDRPLVNNTMRRIAEGIRQHCDERLEPFADAVAELGKEDVAALQEDVVDVDEVNEVAEERCEPFLVKYYGTSTAKPVDEPMDTVTAQGGKYALCTPYLLGQQSGATARSVLDETVPTVATRGAIGLYNPTAFILPRNGSRGGLHSNATYKPYERPLHTVTARNQDGHVVTPFLVEYYGNGSSNRIDEPLPTVTTRDRFALVLPEAFPYGLDIRYRMLQPRELAAAMGFPSDYEFAGNKTETTKQIGNAVPVNLAKALTKQLLVGNEPSLQTFAEQEVVGDD